MYAFLDADKCICSDMYHVSIVIYGTDLTQRRTRIRVTGHHSPSARTQSSISFNGLELGLELELELERKPRVSS